MKVVIVHNSYQRPGGEDVVVAKECALLKGRGHSVICYRRSNDEIQQMAMARRLIMVKDVISSDRSRREIHDLLQSEKPDLVHVHNTFLVISPSIYEVCQGLGVPVVQTLHNFRLLCPGWTLSRNGQVCEECLEDGLWRGVVHACYRNSHLLTAAVALMLEVHRRQGTWNERVNSYVALSNFARNKFIYGGLPAEKIHVKPNFVYPDPGMRESSGANVLFVGRLSPEKGVATLLAAWEKLNSRIPLTIIGDGPLRDSLQAEAVGRNLPGVTFTGWLPPEEIRAAMKRAAFVVTPSLCYEGFGMSIIEAFACGAPVLCSRLGGMQEIVADHRTGFHFTAGDVEDLASKVEWALSHPTDLAAMGREARNEYESHYTAETNYVRLMGIYERTISACARN